MRQRNRAAIDVGPGVRIAGLLEPREHGLVHLQSIGLEDLAIEAAFLLRLSRAPMRLERELLHVEPRDVPLVGDLLRAVELRDGLGAEARDPAFAAGERIGEAERLGT